MRRRIWLLALMAIAGGCQSAPPAKTITGDPMPPKTALDAANDSMGIVDEGYFYCTEALEYIGDKTEDFTRFLGDVYQSL